MRTFAFLTILTFAVSCAPSTQITGSWKNEDAGIASIDKILVTALTGRVAARQAVEDDLAAALERQGYTTIKSMSVLPPTFTDDATPNREELLSRIRDTGADAILTVALIDEETESRYVPGTYGYAPYPRFGYYGTFWGYYNMWYPILFDPGYYEEDKVYFIETNLYDARSEQLLWSAQSESTNPRSLPAFAEDFSQVVVAQLEKDDILSGQGMARENQNPE